MKKFFLGRSRRRAGRVFERSEKEGGALASKFLSLGEIYVPKKKFLYDMDGAGLEPATPAM